jgi:hypothetical protein
VRILLACAATYVALLILCLPSINDVDEPWHVLLIPLGVVGFIGIVGGGIVGIIALWHWALA